MSSLPPSSPPPASPSTSVPALESLNSRPGDDLFIDSNSSLDDGHFLDFSTFVNHDSNDVDAYTGLHPNFLLSCNAETAHNVLRNDRYICPADLELLQHASYMVPSADSMLPRINSYSSPGTSYYTEPTKDDTGLIYHGEEGMSPSLESVAVAPRFVKTEVRHRESRKGRNLPIKDWFLQNVSSPYPSQAQLADLSAASKLSLQQVRNCLSNLRARNKPGRIIPTSGDGSLGLSQDSVIELPTPAHNDWQTCDAVEQNTEYYSIEPTPPLGFSSDTSLFALHPSNSDEPPRRIEFMASDPVHAHWVDSMFSGDTLLAPAVTPKRKGKKRYTSRYDPNVGRPTALSPNTSSDSTHEVDKAYHCTVCPRSFRDPYGWKRHEASVHGFNDTEWTCMLHESIMVGLQCIFCSENVVDIDHFDQHDIQVCMKRSANDRTFARKDLLKQHVRHVHLAAADESVKSIFRVPDTWSKEVDMSLANPDALWCGFCQLFLDTITLRMDHVAQHFRHGEDMEAWVPRLIDLTT